MIPITTKLYLNDALLYILEKWQPFAASIRLILQILQDPGGPHVGPINFVIWLCVFINHLAWLVSRLHCRQFTDPVFHFILAIYNVLLQCLSLSSDQMFSFVCKQSNFFIVNVEIRIIRGDEELEHVGSLDKPRKNTSLNYLNSKW